MKKFVFAFILLVNIMCYSQIPVGSWRDHYSFANVLSAFKLNDGNIMVASPNGLCFFDEDYNYEKLTKTNGLSDVDISTVKYDEYNDITVVAYKNGNIDIISKDKITNISDIKRKNISGNKGISSITINNGFAYLSCGFGIIKLNIVNAEIEDTYYIGENASYVDVKNTLIYHDTIFAATNNGLYAADINSVLADYKNWKILNSPYSFFTDITLFNNNLYAIAFDGDKYRCVKRKDGIWSIVKQNEITENSKLFSFDNLYITNGSKIFKFSSSDVFLQTISTYPEISWIYPQFINILEDGTLLIGDGQYGLVLVKDNEYSYFSPKGVFLDEVLQVSSYNEHTITTRGGYTATGVNLSKKAYVSYFAENQWENIRHQQSRDLNCILQDPSDPTHFFIGTWGYGILEYKADELINWYKEDNSTLVPIIAGNYIRISGLLFDDEKNLWSLNRAIYNPINILKNDGTWVSLQVNEISDEVTGQMIMSENNLVWAVLPNSGLLILDYNNTIDNSNDDIKKVFYPKDEDGESIGSEIFCIAEDKKGNIWFGTNEGVGVFYDYSDFTSSSFSASRIKITAKLNDSLVTNYLLKEQSVLAVAIDGGNRKWFGTSSAGVFLMNETGTEELLHFDTENSPLPSNKVYSIAVDNLSGEVFFATDKGLVSYRAEAIEANDEFENVYVFPNPVRPDYSGTITITGLVYQTNVKITDIAGNIVFETTSEGGQAIWDGYNFDGKRVQTGVYLVFCTNNDGSKTHITKLLFIN